MKNYSFLLFVLLLLLLSCSQEYNDIKDQKFPIQLSSSENLQIKFAKALAQAVDENADLRTFLKTKAYEKFDNDTEILYQIVKNEVINGISFRDILLKYIDSETTLKRIDNELPLLTILVPDLPDFNIDTWNELEQVPMIAVKIDKKNEQVPLINKCGEELYISNDLIPAFPVLVVKQNERVMLNTDIPNKSIDFRTNDNLISYSFLDDAFNGTKGCKKEEKSVYLTNTDQRNIDAYNMGIAWHRDYIYYGLTNTTPIGSLIVNYREFITSFQMSTTTWYTKIADQSGDPKISSSDLWTDGAFEFKITVYVNSRTGSGIPIVKYLSLKGSDIMKPSYTKCSGPQGGTCTPTYYYKISNIVNKIYYPNLELESWDLYNSGAQWKLSVQEIDLTEEFTKTIENSVEFANNFSIQSPVEKLGLTWGNSIKTIQKNTFTVKYSLSSDDLGEATLNFYDPVIVGTELRTTDPYTGGRLGVSKLYYKVKDINTGWIQLTIEPKKLY